MDLKIGIEIFDMRLEKGVSKNLTGESRFFGYLLFLDISGFTALTEKHMSGEYSGAEKVSEILNSIFKPIIKIIYAHGGIVGVFAGDAMSAVFRTNKPENAIECAKEIMRKADKSIFADIRIKIAILEGEMIVRRFGDETSSFYFFDGKPFRELSLATDFMAPGEILISKRIMVALGVKECRDMKKAGKYFILSDLTAGKNKKTASVKKPFLKFSRQTKYKAEFRTVTSVFIDFSKAGRLSGKFIEKTIKLCEKYKANFNMVDSGDKGRIIYVLFGAPKSNEDDIKRSIDLLLELKRVSAVKFKAGVTHGMAFTGAIGSRVRSTYTAIGDNVNSAARIMSKAAETDLIVTEDVFRNLAETYSFDYAGALELKGKINKIHTYLLKGAIRRKEKAYETKFVGRGKHLNLGDDLREILSRGGNGGILYVTGEAGIGKSRLINEICKKFSDFATIYQLSSDDINKKSLFPFINFVKEFFESEDFIDLNEKLRNFDSKFKILTDSISKDASNETAKSLKSLDYVLKGFSGIESSDRWRNLDARARYDLTESALIEFFRSLSLKSPAVFVFEDYHYIDAESKKIINRIIHNLVKNNCLFMFSRRPSSDEQQQIQKEENANFNEIVLGQFDREEMTEFLKDRFLYVIDKKLFEYIMDKSSGNPFYAEQIALYLLENDFITESGGITVLSKNVNNVPSTVYALVISRIDKLKESLKEAVKRAAVIGTEFEVKILSQMLKKEDSISEIKNGEESGIWSPLGEIKYIFKHSIIRDAAYEMQLKKEVQTLHILAAKALEKYYKNDNSKKYDIAVHYDRGMNFTNAKTFYYSGAVFAVENFRNSEAMMIFERLIEISPRFSEKFKNIVSLVNILELTSNWRKGAEILADTLEKYSDKLNEYEMGVAKLKMSYLKLKMGDISNVLSDFEEAESIFRKMNDLKQLMTVHNFQGVAFTRLGEFQKALDKFDELQIEGADESKKKEIKILISESFVNKGFAYQELEKLDDAMVCFAKAQDIAEELSDKRLTAQTLVNIGNVHFFKKDLKKAEEIYTRQLELDRELGDKYIERVILNNLGALESIRFNLNKAIEYMNRSLKLSRTINEKRGERMALGNLGSCHATLGNYKEAEMFILDGLKISRELHDSKGIAVMLDTLSKIYLDTGKHKEAKEFCEEAIRITEESKLKSLFLSVSVTMSQLYLIENEKAEAEKLIEEAFKKTVPEKDIDDHTRLFIVKERITGLKNPDKAKENLQLYSELTNEDGPKGMLLTEMYFISREFSLKEKAMNLLKNSYAKTSDIRYKKYYDCLVSEDRNFTV